MELDMHNRGFSVQESLGGNAQSRFLGAWKPGLSRTSTSTSSPSSDGVGHLIIQARGDMNKRGISVHGAPMRGD